jgi:carbon-monoxide dehydrogenase medium subunit
VIPVSFDYAAPRSLEEAIGTLSQGGEEAKLLAGGHSLLPLMKLRLAAPTLLVDLRGVPGLTGIEPEDGAFRIGAMTTHHQVATGGLGLASEAAATTSRCAPGARSAGRWRTATPRPTCPPFCSPIRVR